MSHVTDIILAYPLVEDDGIAEGLGLARVDQHSLGNKCMQANVWLGARNYLDIEQFERRVAALPWREPENVTLLLQDEQDECFTLRTAWRALVKPHPDSCTCKTNHLGQRVPQGGRRRCPVHQPGA